jgi:hypothetical protein
MRFYWKNQGDQLFVRRGALPTDQIPPSSDEGRGNPWTTFEMDLREPQPIPSPFDFTRFLASSITFMNSLSESEDTSSVLCALNDLQTCLQSAYTSMTSGLHD